ncbi:peptidoglycan D,D-transpeptidase FtsI family protein [Neoactinobaculum massilliense]|uniref:peptidoglycan D,D-transpeptidase FtsI family protein n=1 Tax=Neoactinobaculum massilliense TaxID=2364794 RepID=UPI001F14FBF0|nr:penicillin-binding protein 2 [Neoactinobaculum massilliense]
MADQAGDPPRMGRNRADANDGHGSGPHPLRWRRVGRADRPHTHRVSARRRTGEAGSGKTGMARRFSALVVALLVMAGLLGIRLLDLQVIRAGELSEAADAFRTRTSVIQAKRGEILDSNGAVLAASVQRYNVGVNQNLIGDYVAYKKDSDGKYVLGSDGHYVVEGTGAAAAAKALAPLLDMDRAELGGLLLGGEKKSTFKYIARDISPELWRKINALGIPGIEPESYMKREYPNGAVAGNILGYVGETASDSTPVGQAGVERTQEKILAGTDGSQTVELAGQGAVVPNGQSTITPAKDGRDVQLTIDRDLQAAALDAVNKSVKENSAEWGAAVVEEIGTGRVLAIADSGSPDPGNLSETSPSDWGSRAVQAPVEPGSSGKVVTFSAGIDTGSVSPLTTFTVPSSLTMPNGQTISDNDSHSTAKMTVAGIMAKSYNTGIIQIGDTYSDDVRYDYMKKFGLGQKTGIELPAESAGLLYPPSQWAPRTHYTTMFGQGWAATTLQLAQMIAVVGNKGVWVPPRIIDATEDSTGAMVPTVAGTSHRVISEKSAQTMIQMLQGVTQSGSTGWAAKVDGYNVAGKTGTAQVPDASGNLTKRVGTFVGLIPAEDPQIAVAVVVYNGAGAGYGGTVAAPVFSDIASFAMRERGVTPSQVPLYKYPWFASEIGGSNG